MGCFPGSWCFSACFRKQMSSCRLPWWWLHLEMAHLLRLCGPGGARFSTIKPAVALEGLSAASSCIDHLNSLQCKSASLVIYICKWVYLVIVLYNVIQGISTIVFSIIRQLLATTGSGRPLVSFLQLQDFYICKTFYCSGTTS